ncbi:hypothetical protein [Beduini massiliensis]|uniref:hypothetical protein n=1 Tax=Beduini massiliensis TaxID=1585974 RepID=UPI00059A7E67|nr:hypothetical protein [Beduini massiliensis]
MIDDYLEGFKRYLDKVGEQAILDNYIPEEGDYYLYEIGDHEIKKIRQLQIKYDKKQKITIGSEDYYYDLIKQLDSQSKIFGANKSMDRKKKILSNNYLSFFVKWDRLKKGEVTKEIIEGYYNVLTNPRLKYTSKNSLAIYDQYEQEYGKPDQDRIALIKNWIFTHLNEETKESEKTKYIKIFFIYPDIEQTLAAYEKEGNRYFTVNLYNKNDYNIEADNKILGVSNYNMGLNDKKPYLMNRSRKVDYPFLFDKDRALKQKKFFDLLNGFSNKGLFNIYLDFDKDTIEAFDDTSFPDFIESGLYLRIDKQTKGDIILNQEIIVNYRNHLKKDFIYDNVIQMMILKESAYNGYYNPYRTLTEIEMLINKICFNGYLINNYTTDANKIDNRLGDVKQFLLQYRSPLFSWFHLGKKDGLNHFIYIGLSQLIQRLCNIGEMTKAAHLLNLQLCLMKYIDNNAKETEKIMDVIDMLKEHLNEANNDWNFSNDEEYYFAVGQLAYYYVSQIKAKKKMSMRFSGLTQAKKDEIVKQEIEKLYNSVSYALPISPNHRANKLFGRIMRYKPHQKKVDRWIILAGTASQNLIYMGNSKEEKEDEE